jgi:hypothetical protein
MKDRVFSGCTSLKSICVPASLSFTDGSPFVCSSIEEIQVDQDNPYCSVSGGFLTSLKEMRLIGHFGVVEHVVIPEHYEVIGSYSFFHRDSLLTITFESGTKLTRLGDFAFCKCSSLKSLCVPASVTVVGSSCFQDCRCLVQLTFESGSHLTEIGPCAFQECFSLKSICIPALVQCIGNDSFFKCNSLSRVSFEPGAKLNRIGDGAFAGCVSLHYFPIPGQLEFLESEAFRLVPQFWGFTFEIPSRIRRLRLPRVCLDRLYIPDSVEFVSGIFEKRRGRAPLLEFGQESRLMGLEFDPDKCDPSLKWNGGRRQHIFVCPSEGVLKGFRFKLECL